MAPKKKNTRADKVSKSPPVPSEIDDVWQNKSGIIRRFLEQQPDFQQLCSEVKYTLTKLLRKANVKIAAVTSRAKTLESFLEKIQRKSYEDPFAEATDFAGVRVVCLFPDDLPKVKSLISDEFTVVEGPGTPSAQEIDRFGYKSDHYIVRLGKNTVGPRYDDLKQRVCEIQVRTVLQDAWAILSHNLVYKQEAQIPGELQRWILSLAGALESADFMYQAIRDRRSAYISALSKSAKTDEIDRVATNLDSLSEYLRRAFPGRPLERSAAQLSGLLTDYKIVSRFPTLKDISELLRKTARARAALAPDLQKLTRQEDEASASGEIFRALALTDPEVVDLKTRWPLLKPAYAKARHLVEP